VRNAGRGRRWILVFLSHGEGLRRLSMSWSESLFVQVADLRTYESPPLGRSGLPQLHNQKADNRCIRRCQVRREYWSSDFNNRFAAPVFVSDFCLAIRTCEPENVLYLDNLTAPRKDHHHIFNGGQLWPRSVPLLSHRSYPTGLLPITWTCTKANARSSRRNIRFRPKLRALPALLRMAGSLGIFRSILPC
jgi:hypothetical protein